MCFTFISLDVSESHHYSEQQLHFVHYVCIFCLIHPVRTRTLNDVVAVCMDKNDTRTRSDAKGAEQSRVEQNCRHQRGTLTPTAVPVVILVVVVVVCICNGGVRVGGRTDGKREVGGDEQKKYV